jgi:AcrR family transcriptional regulator
MPDTLESAAPVRRRRSDVQRNIDAIIGAARIALGDRPDASMEDIAAAAGVTRQTVYAHFPSRDALILALIDAAGAETLAVIDTARLDTPRPPRRWPSSSTCAGSSWTASPSCSTRP